MQIGAWQFAPNIWPSVATLVMLPILLALGFWQLDRADQKRSIHERFLLHQSDEITYLNSAHSLRANKDEMRWRNVKANGQFKTSMQVLLDNQVVNSVAGYYVYTPFQLNNEDVWILINRGWLSGEGDRSISPDVDIMDELDTEITGVARDIPATGIRLGEAKAEQLSENLFRVQYIDLKEIEGLLQHDLLPYIINLSAVSAYGYHRDWRMPGSGEERHLGYAFQWFAMAAALLIIYIVVNLKKTNS